MDYEARRFTRVTANCAVEITTATGYSHLADLINLSIGGLIVKCPGEVPAGTECTVQLKVDPATEIEVRGEVIRQDGDSIAIAFSTIMSSDFISFHEFIREHAEDPDIIDTEVQERRHLMPNLE